MCPRTWRRRMSRKRSPAMAFMVERAFTGRANLFAARAGVLVINRAAVNRINNVDEAITFATLSAYKPVVQGEMIATVKLIPFGVEAKLRDAAVAAARRDVLRVAPYRIKRVGIVSTMLPGLAPKVIDKTLRVTADVSRRPEPRSSPSGACRTTKPCCRRRSRTCSISAPNLSSSSVHLRSPTAAMSFLRHSPMPAAWSSISACRSTRAICF